MESKAQDIQFEQRDGFIFSRFQAMASPCELLIETADISLAQWLGHFAQTEALRIEHKFSRYRNDNIIYKINHSHGRTITVDDETAELLDYAGFCYELSEGLFDITSGVLGSAWVFDGRTPVPNDDRINELLTYVGWKKLEWARPYLTLMDGMKIDLGGIGKEYAVDRVAAMVRQHTPCSVLVNFGGDLVCTRPRLGGQGWQVGIEQPDYDHLNEHIVANKVIEIAEGAMATSGDARRHIVKDGKRYGHIINPQTGWPIENAPCSVTVAAVSCTEAGILATMAMLQGQAAEDFLKEQDVQYWIIR